MSYEQRCNCCGRPIWNGGREITDDLCEKPGDLTCRLIGELRAVRAGKVSIVSLVAPQEPRNSGGAP